MNIEQIVSIYKKSGFKISKIGSCFFLNRFFVSYSFPTLIDIELDERIVNILKWRYFVTIVKVNSKIKNTYEYVLSTKDYSLETFTSKTRNQIRKSIKECNFKRPSINDLLESALEINKLTLERHGRGEKFLTDLKLWRKYISSFYYNPNVLFLGAYIEESMVGYLICYNVDGKYTILHPFFDKKYSSSSPMLGLIFSMVNDIIEREGSISVSYGIESFRPNPTLNRFKKSMQFCPVPASRGYIFNPVIYFCLRVVIFCNLRVFKKKLMSKDKFALLINLYQGSRIIEKSCL